MKLRRARIITAVGAGGKTTCLQRRAQEYINAGKRAVITTTTHIWKPQTTVDENGCSQDEDPAGAFVFHTPGGIDYAGTPLDNGKLSMPPRSVWEYLLASYDAVLVEGDGSHCMPVKIPGPGEPVIPEETDEIVVIMGRHAVGRSLKVVCHRYDENRLPDGIVTESVLERIADEFYVRPLRYRYPKADVYYEPGSYEPRTGDLPVTAVLLASGFGRRYGGNKLLDDYDGQQLYRRTLGSVMEALGKDRTVVVTQYGDIMDKMRAEGILALENKEAAEGISASIRIGTREAMRRDDSEAVIFFAADMPYLPADEIRRYADQFLWSGKSYGCMESGPDHIMTNPGAFRLDRADIPGQLLALTGDRGAMRIMKQHPQDIYRYQIAEEAVRDIDEKPEPGSEDQQ